MSLEFRSRLFVLTRKINGFFVLRVVYVYHCDRIRFSKSILFVFAGNFDDLVFGVVVLRFRHLFFQKLDPLKLRCSRSISHRVVLVISFEQDEGWLACNIYIVMIYVII